jgi:membrane dipeptidase
MVAETRSRLTEDPGARALHDDSIVVDGLQIARFDAAAFADMRAANLTAVTCTCSVWESFRDTMTNIAAFQRWFLGHEDLIRPVHTVADIESAKREGRTGIILGFQNLASIEDRLEYLCLFKALGVGMMQLTYNTQNLVGAGCYESRDTGLTDFGHDAVAEMNRVGIVVDLSHVGATTAREAIAASTKPVVYSHTAPHALKPHPRNKTDEDMRRVAEQGGLVGVTLFPPFLAAGNDATVVDYVEAIEHVRNVVGEDHVAIGTDFIDGHDKRYLEWLNHDKGDGRPIGAPDLVGALVNVRMPAGIERIGAWPSITRTMVERGWGEDQIRKAVGANWVRLLAEVWPAPRPKAAAEAEAEAEVNDGQPKGSDEMANANV